MKEVVVRVCIAVVLGLVLACLPALAGTPRSPASTDSVQPSIPPVVPCPASIYGIPKYDPRPEMIAGIHSAAFGSATTEFYWLGHAADLRLGLTMSVRSFDPQQNTGFKAGFRFPF